MSIHRSYHNYEQMPEIVMDLLLLLDLRAAALSNQPDRVANQAVYWRQAVRVKLSKDWLCYRPCFLTAWFRVLLAIDKRVFIHLGDGKSMVLRCIRCPAEEYSHSSKYP